MNTKAHESQEANDVLERVIDLAKSLGLLGRRLSAEALDVEIRGLVVQATNAPPSMVNKCRLAIDDLTQLVERANYLATAAESLKDRIYQ